ncbi:MAG: hypothetical protein OES46_22165, partial [Gammaproteobacteria bacterium]|nr:hypothetical protein [Gammaproteobacteria bacterium]
VIDIRNTLVRETMTTIGPNGEGLITGPIEDHSITIDGQTTDIIAAQPDEVTFETSGVTSNTSGQSEVVLSYQGEPLWTGVADSWGYHVSTLEVTQKDVWVPITLQVFGVEPQEMMRVSLTPTEGQEIEPTDILVSGAEAMMPVSIAQLRTAKLGPQQFFVDVKRGAD